MTPRHLRHKPWARVLAVATAAICVLTVLPSLLPAGLAFQIADYRGVGLLHELFVRFTLAVLLAMPAIALAGVFLPWRFYRRGQYGRSLTWSLATLALIAYWSVWAWGVYVT